jgi:hypothetical protein
MLASLIIIFYLAKRMLKNTGLAWVCYFLFLLNAYLVTCAGCFWKWGFHPQVYYLAYFLALLYFWDKKPKVAALFFCLALLTNELYAIPLFMTMLYFWIKNKSKRRTAAVLAAVSALYFVLATKWIMPLFGDGKTAYNYYALHFNVGRAFDLQLLLGMFVRYWKGLLVHFHFLPVLSPQIMVLALPESLVNVLSEFVIGYRLPASPSSWHSIPAFGFMIWASLGSFYLLTKLIKKRILIYSLSLVLVAFSAVLLLKSQVPRLVQFRGNKDVLISLKKAERLTAQSDSLCVAWGLAAPFAQKRYLYCFPDHYQRAEYILFRPSKENLGKVTGIQYETVFKSPRLILLKNLSFGESADDR